MKWKKLPGEGDVEDRRGQGGGGFGFPKGQSGLPFPLPRGKGGGGVGLLVLIAVAFFLFKGFSGGAGDNNGVTPIDPFPKAPAPTGNEPANQPDERFEFVKFVSKDVQDFWTQQFAEAGKEYERAPVVVFTSGTVSGCGPASSATGPFYCPADHKVYLDVSFFTTLAQRFGAPGDFAQAYVIAHEVGHHVQNLLGIEPEMRRQQQEDPSSANELSVRLELQADCLSGVWAYSTYQRGILEPGDVEEGLQAAAAVGDDRLGARSPESWTHGSAELRTKWFQRGFEGGDVNGCDTFSGSL